MDHKSSDNIESNDIGLKARNAFLWVASTSAIWQVASWVFTIITARILTPTDFGIAALPGTFIPYLTLLAGLELQTWIVQTKSWDKTRAECISSVVMLSGAIATTVSFLAAPQLAAFYNDPSLIAMFRLCSFVFIINNISLVQQAELHRELRFKEISLINMTVNIGQSLVTVGFALSGFGYWSLIFGIILSQCARTSAIIYLKGTYLKLRWELPLIKTALHFGITAASASALWIVFSTVDDITVGKLFGATTLGFYTMAYFFSQLPLSKLNMIVSPVITPYYCELNKRGTSLKAPYLKTARTIVSITAPALLGLSLIATETIQFILGEKWLSIVPILQVLCLVSLMQSVVLNAPSLFNSIGKPGIILKQNILSAIILPTSFILGGLLFNLSGVYFAWLIAYPFVLAFILLQLKRELGISFKENLLNLRAPLISATLMGLTISAIKSLIELSPLASLFALIFIGAIAYSAIMLCFFRKDTLEMITLKKEVENTSA